ncbi:MAG: hypothetical protein WCI89_02275 [bacterium]
MNLLRTYDEYPSEKNGTVFVWRTFPWSHWQLGASGYGQTTDYTNAMWLEVTRDIARMKEKADERLARVFIGGLGGAGHLPILKKFFPNCHIEVAEHDPVIINVVEKYNLCPQAKNTDKDTSIKSSTKKDIEIIEGDMFEVLGNQVALGKKYDLLCIDIFTGEYPSNATVRQDSVALARSALAPEGILVANVFKNAEYLDPLATAFKHHKKVVFRANTLGIFWDHELERRT